jgi:hypothetical protein
VLLAVASGDTLIWRVSIQRAASDAGALAAACGLLSGVVS